MYRDIPLYSNLASVSQRVRESETTSSILILTYSGLGSGLVWFFSVRSIRVRLALVPNIAAARGEDVEESYQCVNFQQYPSERTLDTDNRFEAAEN
jgi:hypothetical protein